jgi:membrane associated rhomboid family serine protease/Zn-finger nucleic acid-binding protein
MFLCPKDRTELRRQSVHGTVYWSCLACGGRTATTGVLRRTANRNLADQFWMQARATAADGPRRCPACERPMKTVALPVDGRPLELDLCLRCYLIWFDPQEFETFPPRSTEGPEQEKLPLEARLMLAKVDVEALDMHPDFELPPSDPPPEGWKSVPAMFGLPVKNESQPLARPPLATWLIAGTIAILGGLALLDLNEVVPDFGLIPAQPWRDQGLTFLTSFLLHGSLPQLAGNVYFLLTFGDDVEEYLGTERFLIVLLLASLGGSALHIWLHPHSYAPLVGASSALSGILTCYALQFPFARIGFLLRVPGTFLTRWVNFRAWVYVLLWIGLQTIGAFRQTGDYTQVSLAAHLGGVAVGFLTWFLLPAARPPEPAAESSIESA